MSTLQTSEFTYVIAVSGGVDSMVLLHKLVHDNRQAHYVVAHVNHGIRLDADLDQALVRRVSQTYGLVFECTSLHLGPAASEELARTKRYKFLREVQQRYNARAVITAHHQDDVIETSFINLIRGTGRRGLTSLDSHDTTVRPLLNVPKADILAYAKKHDIEWREDSTNQNQTILRNKIRHCIVASLTPEQRLQILNHIDRARIHNQKINKELNSLLQRGLHKGQPVLNRAWLRRLPHDISKEVIYCILTQHGATNIDKTTVDRMVIGIKTLPAGKTLQAAGVDILLTKRSARIKKRSQTD